MVAELMQGQNHPLARTRLEIRASAATPVVAAAMLGDEGGRLRGAEYVAHPGAPALPGVEVPGRAAVEHRIAVDLGALPVGVRRVTVLLALPHRSCGPGAFGAVAAPYVAVHGPDGEELASFTLTGLSQETAVSALELYRRDDAWRVRAFGQGYAGGLTEMFRDHGLADAVGLALAAAIDQAVSRDLARPVAVGAVDYRHPARRPADEPGRDAGRPAADIGRADGLCPDTHPVDAVRGNALPVDADSPDTLPVDAVCGDSLPMGPLSGDRCAGDSPAPRRPVTGRLPADHRVAAGLPTDTCAGDGDRPADRRAASGVPADLRSTDDRPGDARPAGKSATVPAPRMPERAEPADPPVAHAQDAERQGTGPTQGAGPVQSGLPDMDLDRPEDDQPVAGDASGWSMEERLHNQVQGMFEDLARTMAGYRGAVDFAESRLEQEMDRALADRATRDGAAGEAARDRARAKRDDLVDQARAALDRDLRQLTAESEVVEPALPVAYAGWESPVWQGYRTPVEPPMAVRVGDLHLPEVPELRIPMLIRLPLTRGLWVDRGADRNSIAGGGLDPAAAWALPAEALEEDRDAEARRRRAMEMTVALATRLIAAHPVGEFTVHLIDPAGSAADAFAPLRRSGALREVPGTHGVAGALTGMSRRVDLIQMALRAGAPESLPPDLEPGEQLLIVNDFPYGFDDRAITQLRYLADEGPSAGVHLLMVADRADARAFGPVLDPLWRSFLRLTPLPDDHLADPWVGHAWTYEPLLPPEGSRVIEHVIREIAAARQAHGP